MGWLDRTITIGLTVFVFGFGIFLLTLMGAAVVMVVRDVFQ